MQRFLLLYTCHKTHKKKKYREKKWKSSNDIYISIRTSMNKASPIWWQAKQIWICGRLTIIVTSDFERLQRLHTKAYYVHKKIGITIVLSLSFNTPTHNFRTHQLRKSFACKIYNSLSGKGQRRCYTYIDTYIQI